jgi:uncharacterized protein
VLAAAGLAFAAPAPRAPMPAVDHHVHLQSARVVSVLVRLKEQFKEAVEPGDRAVTGAGEVVAALDASGIRQAVVLSGAYLVGTPDLTIDNERDEVRRENDWTAAEGRRFPERLVPFASVNPLKDYAVDEVTRTASTGLRGLKLHFTNSAVDLRSPAHVERVKAVFKAANARRLPVLAHIRTRAKDYGATDARVFVDDVLSAAPDVPVVVAHMGGWGGYDRATDAALDEIVSRCARARETCRHLYFDTAFTVLPESAASAAPGTSLRVMADAQRDFADANGRMAARIRSFGPSQILFGSDWPGAMTPREEADAIRKRLPLPAPDMDTLFSNVAPFFGRPAAGSRLPTPDF